MKRFWRIPLLSLVAVLLCETQMFSQRRTDVLDRGLTATKVANGVYLSWRIPAEEYHDVEYNVYRDGSKLNKTPLTISNFTDTQGTVSNTYTVSPIIKGKEQEQCKAITVNRKSYLTIPLDTIHSRRGYDITEGFRPQKASTGDLDGDGRCEIILRRGYRPDESAKFPLENDSAFSRIEIYDLDGNRLWYIDCGPNMASTGLVETNVICYDWDGDGRAEVLLRGADDMYIHTDLKNSGKVYPVGIPGANTRHELVRGEQIFTSTGNEYLLYLDGATGIPYQIIDYPLPRGTSMDWGDNYGHRSSKHFFGAPYLDGRHPSIWLARGIYTKIEMVTFDVDPATHTLTERWRWSSVPLEEQGDKTWSGNGYHANQIADVDMDGRDEIVYGSMIIDDNGKGLSTTGLGHGDDIHVGDFDPYRHGLEIMACNETTPGSNFRDATTSKLYAWFPSQTDVDRCMAGNFTDLYPGAEASSNTGGVISCVTDKVVDTEGKLGNNYRLYWDGDLLEEFFNFKKKSDAIGYNPYVFKSSFDNSKDVTVFSDSYSFERYPMCTCDILGDWREEVILMSTDMQALHIHYTTIPTEWRNYALHHDHQYDQQVTLQMCGYSQPPHAGYFLGTLENITQAPPPLSMTERTEICNGGEITTTDGHLILAETNDMTVSVAEGAAPYMLTVNTPSWTQGNNDNDNIVTTYYTHTLTGGAFAGGMHLVKQGEGILVLPNTTHTYSGRTDVWNGTLQSDGKIQNSPVWMNRFTTLQTTGGTFRSVTMDYASRLQASEKTTIDTLKLGFGSRICHTISTDNLLKIKALTIEQKDWEHGPQYLTPVIDFSANKEITEGEHLIAEIGRIDGEVNHLVIEGLSGRKAELTNRDGKLYLIVHETRANTNIIWKGSENSIWDFGTTMNFVTAETPDLPDCFITGDNVLFNDEAGEFTVTLDESVEADTVTFDHSTHNYTLKGNGRITGGTFLIKEGSGTLDIQTANDFTGGVLISGGTVKVSSLGNEYSAKGGLGAANNKFALENGAVLNNTEAVQMTSRIQVKGKSGGEIKADAKFTMSSLIYGTLLTKTGDGNLYIEQSPTLDTLKIRKGTVTLGRSITPGKNVVLIGGTLAETSTTSTYESPTYKVEVPAGSTARWELDGRCNYKGKLTGSGNITVYMPWYRCFIDGDWSEFTGTLTPTYANDDFSTFAFNNSYGMPNATLVLDDNTTLCNNGKTFRIGEISGTGILSGNGAGQSGGSNTWELGNDENWTWGGYVTGANKFNKVGSGKLTLQSAMPLTGSVTVKEGELQLTSKATLGTGTLTVSKGAILRGYKNILGNSTTTINGELRIGLTATSTSGNLDFGGKNLTFGATGIYNIGLSKCATASSTGGTYICNINKLTLNGTVSVYLASSFSPKAGDYMYLWKDVATVSGTPSFDLPALGDDLEWDTSEVITKGLLHIIASASAIPTVERDGQTTTTGVYDLTGRKVADSIENIELEKGIYIINGKKIVIR